MIGSFLSRVLIMIFGYAYPAYECYKVVEKRGTEIEKLLFWCHYWILVAMLTVCERIGDNLISWLPMYSEAKLAFFVYLWHQKTRGTIYVYNCIFRPFVRKHEAEIDHTLLELRVKGWEMALFYWEKASIYGHMKFFEILQYASSQSALWPRSGQQAPTGGESSEPYISDPISQDTKGQSQSKKPHEPSKDLEEKPNEQSSSSSFTENKKPEFSQQEAVPSESAGGKRILFRSARPANH